MPNSLMMAAEAGAPPDSWKSCRAASCADIGARSARGAIFAMKTSM